MPLVFRRDPLLSDDEAACIHDLAKQILHQIGLEICHAGALQTLAARGFEICGNDRRRALDEIYIAAERARP